MSEPKKEQDVRRHVKKLRQFYLELLNYILVNALLILVWLLVDWGSSFWPKWVILIWGLVLVVKGYRMGILPAVLGRLHFMSEEWENRKVDEMMGSTRKSSPPHAQHRIDGRTKKED